MDQLSFEQLSRTITEAKDKTTIAHVIAALSSMPLDEFRAALEGFASKKLKQLTENH